MSFESPKSKNSPTLFSLPTEVLEEILSLLNSNDLKRLLSLTDDGKYRHFRRVCEGVLVNADLLERSSLTHPVISHAVRHRLGDSLLYPKYGNGEKVNKIIECLEEAMREGDFVTKKVSLDTSVQSAEIVGNFFHDVSTGSTAWWRFKDEKTILVEIHSKELILVKSMQIGRIANGTSLVLFGRWLIWIERDTNSLYTFLHLKLKEFYSPGETSIRSIPISKFQGRDSFGVTKVLVSSRWLVTYDGKQFSVFTFPSMEFHFRQQSREPQVVHAALQAGFLYVSTDIHLTVWNLKERRQCRTLTMDGALMRGTRVLMFPYLFYRIDNTGTAVDSPPEWICTILDEHVEPPARRMQLDMETFLKELGLPVCHYLHVPTLPMDNCEIR